jgi:hypothetical protein
MATTSGAPSFSMHASNMNPQQMQNQRMQPPPQSSTPTQPGQRASPYGGMSHNTPPNAASAQSQLNTPQANQSHGQTANNGQQNQAGMAVTPQTPTFPAGSQGVTGGALAGPLSPGSEVREKERVTVMLEINSELLMEGLRLQSVGLADKKDEVAAPNSPEITEDKEKAEKVNARNVAGKEYMEYVVRGSHLIPLTVYRCMRRLQVNLAYLATIADRSHKPASQIPSHPAIMNAPNLSSRVQNAASASSPDTKVEGSEEKTVEKAETPEESDERVKRLNDLYKRLQALFPGVDSKKDALAQQAARQMQVKQQQAQAQAQSQLQGGQGQAGEQTPQQKMQQELYRQRIMQQAQQNAVAAQQNQQGQQQGQGQGQ